jgi:hypothetical protein
MAISESRFAGLTSLETGTTRVAEPLFSTKFSKKLWPVYTDGESVREIAKTCLEDPVLRDSFYGVDVCRTSPDGKKCKHTAFVNAEVCTEAQLQKRSADLWKTNHSESKRISLRTFQLRANGEIDPDKKYVVTRIGEIFTYSSAIHRIIKIEEPEKTESDQRTLPVAEKPLVGYTMEQFTRDFLAPAETYSATVQKL